MTWHAHLQLAYRRDGERTVAHDRHRGPLRVLQSLYPEGAAICHHVLVHPPAGIVGGDLLELDATLAAGSHALITTPGATKFYRSAGLPAHQAVHVRVDDAARLEWLPQETIAYQGCSAHNRLVFDLAPGAEMIGWDVLALGLPAASQPFAEGRVHQHLELPGAWLERGRIDAHDHRLLQSPVGLDGRGVLAVMWWATGRAMPPALRDRLLDDARAAIATSPLATHAGATAVNDRVVVMRALATRVEPAAALLRQVWPGWRRSAWDLDAPPVRLWKT